MLQRLTSADVMELCIALALSSVVLPLWRAYWPGPIRERRLVALLCVVLCAHPVADLLDLRLPPALHGTYPVVAAAILAVFAALRVFTLVRRRSGTSS